MKDETRKALRTAQLEEKLRWLFHAFESCLGKDPLIDTAVHYVEDNDMRYWSLFFDSKESKYGYALTSSIPRSGFSSFYIEGHGGKNSKYDISMVMACVDLLEPLVSNSLFRTDKSMEYWYRMDIQPLEHNFVIPIETKE